MGYTATDSMTDNLISALKHMKAGNLELAHHHLVYAASQYEIVYNCPQSHVTKEEVSQSVEFLNKEFHKNKSVKF